jgi:serine/threonine-protein kinase
VAAPRDQPSWTGPIAAILGGGDRASWTGNPMGHAPSQPEEYAPGHVIANKYRLTRIIGKGGMGAVWHAQSLTLDIDVAVKLIRRDKSAPAAAIRLLQEARAAARLNHPSIVRVYEFGETQWGDPFIAMEFLHGESLDAVLARKGRLPPTTAVQTLLPVASALSEAHSKGVIHRDLKPENIFLVTGEQGSLTPKVVDFGIAKLVHSDLERNVTLAGEVVGSPDYMSPEQARGDDQVGEATDVWAFSVVLYQAITGRRPFDGPNYNSLIAAILTANPASAAALGACDAAFWNILERGLAKDVSARWPTIKALATALAAWVCERGIEEDITGTQIARQWLTEKGRRLLTVLPQGEAAAQAIPRAALEVAPPPHAPPPLQAPAARMAQPPGVAAPPRYSAPSTYDDLPWKPSLARRLLVPIGVLLLLGGGALAAYFAVGQDASDPVATPAPSAPVPSAVATEAPPAEPAPEASSAPSSAAAASARPLPTSKTAKPKPSAAPKVPKHINF